MGPPGKVTLTLTRKRADARLLPLSGSTVNHTSLTPLGMRAAGTNRVTRLFTSSGNTTIGNGVAGTSSSPKCT
ncbi:hypothetical protein D3C80_1534430 [compost metagenome]